MVLLKAAEASTSKGKARFRQIQQQLRTQACIADLEFGRRDGKSGDSPLESGSWPLYRRSFGCKSGTQGPSLSFLSSHVPFRRQRRLFPKAIYLFRSSQTLRSIDSLFEAVRTCSLANIDNKIQISLIVWHVRPATMPPLFLRKNKTRMLCNSPENKSTMLVQWGKVPLFSCIIM